MMNDQYINPFDDERFCFLVLTNEKQQHSLWPEFSPVPRGWQIVFGPEPKLACTQYIELNWIDIRT